MSRSFECEVAGNCWKMQSPHLTTCQFSESLDWNNNSFKIAWVPLAMTEGAMENVLKVDGNYENSNKMPLDEAISHQHTGHHVLFSAIVELWVSLGLLQCLCIFSHPQEVRLRELWWEWGAFQESRKSQRRGFELFPQDRTEKASAEALVRREGKRKKVGIWMSMVRSWSYPLGPPSLLML